MTQWNCLTCGAPLTVESRFARMVTCDFCGHVHLIHDDRLTDTGRVAHLVDIPSPLYIDATGTLLGRRFRVLGRLQYTYEDGTWQEWYLVFDEDTRGWLVEDGGTYTLYDQHTLVDAAPDPGAVRVGATVHLAGKAVFVTEVGEAEIVGGEGQLGFQLLPGERIRYIDGTADGQQVTLEVGADEVEFMAGRELPVSELQIDEDGW